MIVRKIACLLALSLAVAGASYGNEPGFGEHRLGLIPEDLRDVPGVVEVHRVDVLPGRPCADSIVHVDLSPQMPPVGNQGAQGSCVAWATGYYHKTHTEWVEHGWNVNDPRYQSSPAFIYNQVNGGVDRGTSGSVVMKLICEQGCASMADCPYNQYDYTTWPSESAFCRAMWLRGDQPHWIGVWNTTGINQVRQRLANGYTSFLGIQVWANFDSIRNFNYTYCSCERYGSMRGWHAVTIVGYDDTLTTSDGPGAFRLVNSWGTGWGDAGFFWMSYVAIMDTMMTGRQVEYASDRIDYRPLLLGRVRISHPSREKVGIRMGLVPIECPLWYRDFRSWRRPGADRPFPDHNIVFDLTDGEWLLSGGPEDSVFVGCIDDFADGLVGTIDFFSVEHLDWHTLGISPDPPVAIPDAGVSVHAVAHIPSAGVEERRPLPASRQPLTTTIVRGVLWLPASAIRHSTFALLNSAGRKVAELVPGPNDIRHLAPGVYFVSRASGSEREASSVHKVVIQR
ncbi:hypothetical protein CH330_03360 [candidate division WOR-3 bacterium JGI_Cruoil_03_51_56]|uniref:Peptidase C1A papain C-terminal domain-containing protein n=2 Tax=candidate division WOR-3 bacterium JGI_Cruoil_03_51_56 TaxID=1973747 RepID=A0A235BVI9_UNCW3|nr:MAG: hypothetical protein CH330_03360 [candidate division WOR-3 bacterium JGI_Cruoil_03_51_56]